MIKKISIFLTLSSVCWKIGTAESQASEIGELTPTALMKHETKWLSQALEQAHYNKVSIKDLNATFFINSYLKKLDPQKLYFTNNEVEEFHKNFSPSIITYFEQGNLFPAYEIFNKYRENALFFLNTALSNIEKEVEWDSNKSYFYDRSKKTDWEQTNESLQSTWNDLICHEILNEVVNAVDLNGTLDDFNASVIDEKLSEARKILIARYKRWKKNIEEFESSDVQELYLTALTQSFDPHTTFMNIKEKEKFDQAMNNEFVGIGAVLTDVDGYCTIKELLPGGPAEACRELEAEDIIMKVAQSQGEFVDVVDMKLSKIVELIKGPKDTIVRLEVKPLNTTTTKIVSIVRDKIKLTERLAKASVHQVNSKNRKFKLGVIELPSFYGSSGNGPKATDDVEELIGVLKTENVEGLILDLRRNGGGYLSEAVNLAGLFISRGPVVQVKSTDGKIRKKFDFDPKLSWNEPLIILVSRYSASASEIVAGALQNHKRAIIVGDSSTHGKGTVQSLLQMNLPFNLIDSKKKGSAAKVTIQKYYLPSGESTQILGVKSDIAIPSINELLPIGESDLENALEWDSIQPVSHRRPDHEFLYDSERINKIAILSAERQKKGKEFDYIRKNIELYKKKKDNQRAALNLKKRFEERKSDTSASDELKSMYESLKNISFPSKKVTLKVVDDQLTKSRIARGVDDMDKNSTKNSDFKKPESLDIRLHESLRILSDWITLREKAQISGNLLPSVKEI